MKIEVDGYSDIGGRPENEDSGGIWRLDREGVTEGVIAIIADGLGGQGDGKAASDIVSKSLLQHRIVNGVPDKEAIDRFFEQANQELISRQQNSFHMKTTAVYLYVNDGQAIWAHIGDSRLYHLYNGKLSHYTLDHSASQLAVYMGEITREDIPTHAGRSRLLHAMGVKDEHPDVHDAIRLQPGEHVFLLCSDGLWEYLSDSVIEDTWNKTKNTQAFLDQIRREKDKRSPEDCDNNSAVVVYVKV